MENLVFYHGGAEPDFKLEDLDVLRPAQKQQNQNMSYAGFYMYSEKDRDGAFGYAEQENSIKKTDTKGVLKLSLDPNLKIYEVPPFSITRVTKDQIIALQNQGYDLMAGKVLGKYEFILINKDKLVDMEFLPMSERYNDPTISEENKKNFDKLRQEDMQQKEVLRQQLLNNLLEQSKLQNNGGFSL